MPRVANHNDCQTTFVSGLKYVRFLDASKGKALKLAACQEMLIGGFFLQRFLDIGESYVEPR